MAGGGSYLKLEPDNATKDKAKKKVSSCTGVLLEVRLFGQWGTLIGGCTVRHLRVSYMQCTSSLTHLLTGQTCTYHCSMTFNVVVNRRYCW